MTFAVCVRLCGTCCFAAGSSSVDPVWRRRRRPCDRGPNIVKSEKSDCTVQNRARQSSPGEARRSRKRRKRRVAPLDCFRRQIQIAFGNSNSTRLDSTGLETQGPFSHRTIPHRIADRRLIVSPSSPSSPSPSSDIVIVIVIITTPSSFIIDAPIRTHLDAHAILLPNCVRSQSCSTATAVPAIIDLLTHDRSSRTTIELVHLLHCSASAHRSTLILLATDRSWSCDTNREHAHASLIPPPIPRMPHPPTRPAFPA